MDTEFKQVSSLLNFAHPTGFVIDIPFPDLGIGAKLEKIGYKASRFAMNIQSFTLNRMSIGVNEVSRSAYMLHIPNQTDETAKEFTIDYALSSEYQQYYFLNLWYQANLKVIKHIEDDSINERFYTNPDYLLIPITLWVLNDNKDPAMRITYKDCFLREMGDLALSYTDNSPMLTHSFTCNYNDFEIELFNERLGNV